jgi:dUTP diphosphatase
MDMERLTLQVRKLNPRATLPTYGSAGAIGLDLYALDSGFLVPGDRRAVLTGIAVAVPDGWYGRVAPRSGLAIRGGIDVLAGVIDDDYRGDVSVMLINHGDTPFSYEMGDRIGQLIIERADKFEPLEVPSLPVTKRGDSGFGSTGR